MPIGNTFSSIVLLVSAACAGVGVFTAARAIRNRVDGRLPDLWLAGLLFLCSANTMHPFLEFHGGGSAGFFMEPMQFLLPICLLRYLRALGNTKAFHPADLLMLLLPAAFIAARYTPAVSSAELPSGLPVVSLAMWVTMAAFSMVLLVPVAAEIARYRNSLKTVHSNLAGIDPGWLKALLASMGILFFVYALLTVLMLHAPSWFPRGRILSLLMAVLTVHLSWMSLGRKPHLPAEKAGPENAGAEPGLDGRAKLIRSKLETGRLFLNPDLTLDDLAREAGLSRHETSAALNRGLGVSFFDLVNGLRIEEFKRLCVDPRTKHEKILTLALEAGFNSKPAFNLIFKKTTGLTPSEYRKTAQIVS